jgi:hypothetical protein
VTKSDSETAEQFRARALDLFRRADAAKDARSRTVYTELAVHWAELALRAEEWEKAHGATVQ